MADWTYTINSIKSGDMQTWCSVALLAHGSHYQNFDFPVIENLTDVDADGLKSIITPYVKGITDGLNDIYNQQTQTDQNVENVQEVVGQIQDPIIVE